MKTEQEIRQELERREDQLSKWIKAENSPMRTHIINLICEGIEALNWVLKQEDKK